MMEIKYIREEVKQKNRGNQQQQKVAFQKIVSKSYKHLVKLTKKKEDIY